MFVTRRGNFLSQLALPNLYIWLVMFYSFFHLWLNILSELLRFGDRRFYKVRLLV